MLGAAFAEEALEHDAGIEDVVVVAHDDIHPVGDIQRKLKGTDLVLPRHQGNVVAVEVLQGEQFAHGRLVAVVITPAKGTSGGIATGRVGRETDFGLGRQADAAAPNADIPQLLQGVLSRDSSGSFGGDIEYLSIA